MGTGRTGATKTQRIGGRRDSLPREPLNRSRSRVRARGEHAFQVVKRLWGCQEARYRGLAKNAAWPSTAIALANLYLVRRRLAASGAKYTL